MARYVDHGFNSDDIRWFCDAIDASPGIPDTPSPSQIPFSSSVLNPPKVSTLPHLPTEIQFMILDNIPINFVLDFRCVSKCYRDYIDTGVLYSYLPRTKLLGRVTNREKFKPEASERDREELSWIHATFSHLIDSDNTTRNSTEQKAKWDRKLAVFRLEERWFDTLLRNYPSGSKCERHLARLSQMLTPGSFTKLSWCVRLDNSVLEVDLGKIRPEDPSMWVDVENKTAMMDWKTMLKNLLISETTIRKMMDEKRGWIFTWGHEKDCVAAVRRRRTRNLLDENDPADRRLMFEMRYFDPVFGKSPIEKVVLGEEYRAATFEEYSLKWLWRWRKEASMSQKEADSLLQLAEDRRAMWRSFDSLNKLFGSWQSNMYDSKSERTSIAQAGFLREIPPAFKDLEYSPFFWTESVTAREEQRVRKWKSQEESIKSMVDILRVSHETLNDI